MPSAARSAGGSFDSSTPGPPRGEPESALLRLGVDERQVELTRLAATLHDVGKLAIPEQILRKPTPLTDAERSMLERHPQIGYRMLETLDADSIADWVLHHHERWDGTGYPDRLAGSQIPLGSRILFVADAFAAMTSERAYANPVPQREALAELTRCAGTQFDPKLVAAFADEIEGNPGFPSNSPPSARVLSRG